MQLNIYSIYVYKNLNMLLISMWLTGNHWQRASPHINVVRGFCLLAAHKLLLRRIPVSPSSQYTSLLLTQSPLSFKKHYKILCMW